MKTEAEDQEPQETAEAEEEETAEAGEVEETAETTEPSTPKPANEMKVVIIAKDDNIMLGVQSPDCDPVYTTMKGTLAMALKKVPALVAKAKKKWSTSPLNPTANLPEPAPAPAPARTTAVSRSTTPAPQPKFF